MDKSSTALVVEAERKAEREAHVSARQWQATFNAITDPLFLLDAGGRIVRCNKAALDLTGKPRSEVIGQNGADVLQQDSGQSDGDLFARALETMQRESQVWQADDRWFEATVDPMLDEHGYLIGLVYLLKDITEQKESERAIRRRARELERLVRAGRAFNASLELDRVLTTVLEEVRHLLDVAGCSIWLMDPATEELVCRQASGPQGDTVRGWRLSSGEGLAGWVATHSTSSMVADTRRDPRHFDDVGRQSELGVRSILTVPLQSDQHAIGVLQAVDQDAQRFKPTDARLLESLAASATLAIEKAQAYERTQHEIAERRRVEAALREAEARYRTLFERIPIGLYRTTPEGKLLDANPALAAILGCADRESLLEADAIDFYADPEDRARRLERLQTMDTWESREVQLRRRDGQPIWVLDSGRAVRDEEGRIRYYEGALKNITERKQAEEALRASEARFRATFERAAIGVALVDAEGRPMAVNPALQEMLGYSDDELRGMRFTEFTHPEDREADWRRFQELMRGERDAYRVEKRYHRKDGEVLWGRMTASLVRDVAGNAAFAVAMVEDITEHRRAAAALEKRVSELTLLNKIGTKITRKLGLEALLEDAVGIVRRTFGYQNVSVLVVDQQRRELVAKAIAGWYADVVPKGTRMALDEGIIGWAARHREPVLANDAEADARYFNCSPERISTGSELSVPIAIADEVIGVLDVQSKQQDAFGEDDVVLLQTVADQMAVAMENARLFQAERAARDRLRDLTSHLQNTREKERARIAREIHDGFGQMMTALKMDLSWLQRRLPDDPRLRDKAAAMSEMIDSSFQTVRRISSELRPGILDDLGLAAAIEWQAETFTDRSGIACELDLDSDGDGLDPELSTALFRILQEALTNVARHAEATRVRVRLEVTPGEVALTVEDDGRGITQDELTSSDSLGLIGMKERARALGGTVTMEGRPRRGTTVITRIPRRMGDDRGRGPRGAPHAG